MNRLAAEGGAPVRTAPWPKWPIVDEEDVAAVADVVRRGVWYNIEGGAVGEFEQAFAAFQGARHGIAVNSGTVALQVALMALGIGPGDEVIVPAYTFVASATAVLLSGATPVLVDVEADTYNLDPEGAERAITEKTRAILPVHFAGGVAALDRLETLCRRHNLLLVEDAAHSHGARWRGRGLGTWGRAGCFSLQGSKNLNAGEGGIILTDEDALVARCRSLRNNGRMEGAPGYEHHLPGGNFRMTAMQGALLRSQMRRLEEQTVRRDANGRFLNEQLGAIRGIRPLRRDPAQERHAHHLYLFRYDAAEFGGLPRERFLHWLRAEGVPAYGGYSIGLHRQPVFTGEGVLNPIPDRASCIRAYDPTDFPNTERACAQEAVWLAQPVLLAERRDMEDIVTAVQKIRAATEAET